MIKKFDDLYTPLIYKGIIYYDNFLVPHDPLRYFIADKTFLEEKDIKNYIEKTLLREKKLERLKGI